MRFVVEYKTKLALVVPPAPLSMRFVPEITGENNFKTSKIPLAVRPYVPVPPPEASLTSTVKVPQLVAVEVIRSSF